MLLIFLQGRSLFDRRSDEAGFKLPAVAWSDTDQVTGVAARRGVPMRRQKTHFAALTFAMRNGDGRRALSEI
jgi:hypothetical protein